MLDARDGGPAVPWKIVWGVSAPVLLLVERGTATLYLALGPVDG